MIAYLGDPEFEKKLGNHIEIRRCMDFPTETEKGLFRDEFGVIWDRRDGSDIGIPYNTVLKEAKLDGFTFPKPVVSEIRREMKELSELPDDVFKMVNVGFTLYERAWSLRGIENLLVDMLLDEDFVSELFDKIVAYNIACMDEVLKTGVQFDAFYFGDDWGYQNGLIMRPEIWRKIIGPRVALLLEYAKKHDKYTFFHSCGNILELFPDLIDAGLDAYDTFQPEIYNIREVKKTFGKKLSFLGGISTQCLLPCESPQVVYARTREIMEIMGESGGFIAAPTHDIPHDVPPENIMAMIEAFKNQ